jgi:hypothetical protein
MLLGQANRLESNTDRKPTATLHTANNKNKQKPLPHNMERGKTVKKS